MPASIKAASTRSRSAVPIDEPSPVVPNRVQLAQPAAKLRLAWAIIMSITISPASLNGVVRATESPKRFIWSPPLND
jgi:hypothetical protein